MIFHRQMPCSPVWRSSWQLRVALTTPVAHTLDLGWGWGLGRGEDRGHPTDREDLMMISHTPASTGETLLTEEKAP